MRKISANRREQLLRVKKKIEEKIEEQLRKIKEEDPLTINEISWRDEKLHWFSKISRTHGFTANHITYFGLVCVAVAHITLWYNFLAGALVIGTIGVLTDFLDGPVARWKDPLTGNDNVTGWGTFLDHLRDFYYASLFGWYTFFSASPHIYMYEIFLLILVALSYFIIFVPIFFGSSPHDAAISQSSPSIKIWRRRFSGYCLMHFQTRFWGRVQFNLLAQGIIILLLGKLLEIESLRFFGYTILGGEIVMGIRNFTDDRRWN